MTAGLLVALLVAAGGPAQEWDFANPSAVAAWTSSGAVRVAPDKTGLLVTADGAGLLAAPATGVEACDRLVLVAERAEGLAPTTDAEVVEPDGKARFTRRIDVPVGGAARL